MAAMAEPFSLQPTAGPQHFQPQHEQAAQLAQLTARNQELEAQVQALSQSERRYQAMLLAVPDHIMRISRAGIYLDFIKAKHIGVLLDVSSRIGRSVREVLPSALAAQYLTAIDQAIATQQPQTFEYELVVAGKPAEYEARVVHSGPDEALLLVRDISTRKAMERALRSEQERSEQLLHSILPRAISDRLKAAPGAIADGFEDVTVLFADLVGFTQMSSLVSPAHVVALLNQVFSRFDALSEKYGLEKIKTIGDAYMVAGGIPLPHPHHTEVVCNMALEMIQVVADIAQLEQRELAVRIGINAGPVVAGIIGTRKFSYDLWGDTVNIASRMESHGLPAHIQVTQAVHDRAGTSFVFEPRAKIVLKGRGEMQTYWLVKKTG
jgi:class 3 adenylate cyclase